MALVNLHLSLVSFMLYQETSDIDLKYSLVVMIYCNSICYYGIASD